jgi:hypothetical protein
MTAVANSRRCALMNAYFTPDTLPSAPIAHGPPLVLTTTQKVYVKAWEVRFHRAHSVSKKGTWPLPPHPS